MKNAVMCVLVKNRNSDAPKLQEVLTSHGCIIKTRIGVHEVSHTCAEDGLIMLHLTGSSDDIINLEKDINDLSEIRAKTLYLDF